MLNQTLAKGLLYNLHAGEDTFIKKETNPRVDQRPCIYFIILFNLQHDTTLAPFLAAIGQFDNKRPTTASCVLLELYQDTDKNGK